MRKSEEAPLISYVRFGPGSIIFLSLIAILAAIFYLFKHEYLALGAVGVDAVFFGVKSIEKIRISRPMERKLIGQTCLVVKSVRTGQQGIVKLF